MHVYCRWSWPGDGPDSSGRKVRNDPDKLLALTKSSDAKIAYAAVADLGRGKATPDVLARLKDLWNNPPNDRMRNQALNALLTLTKDNSLAEAAWNTDSFDDGIRESAMNYFVGADPNRAREMALEAISDKHTEYLREAAIDVMARVKDKAGEKKVFNVLVSLLNDPGHEIKRGAVGAIRAYGDPAAIPYLQKFTDYSMYQIREPAKSAIAELSKKQ